ncbi:3'-5' exonuclease [Clostridium sp.]|uniref:3'-5' exonuclease n=1 Tax=Clostridium sp. TaxID=1506 RepID=UPI0026281783|nr:3'-5' exonuclease [Clostridium sp.]
MNFNKEQEIVIKELEENILLLASAGTGKTNTLAYRVANILKNNKAKANEILCITFTNKSCKEMSDRIESIVLESKEITIKTFHSFCFDLIKSYAKRKTDIFTDFIVFDEEDCKEIIKELKIDKYSPLKIQKFIDMVKIESSKVISKDKSNIYSLSINNIFKYQKDRIDYLCSDKGDLNIDMIDFLENNGERLVKAYNNILYSSHGLDFCDLTLKAKEMMEDKDIVKSLMERYKYINIDEVQDTSSLEYSIIEKIFEGNNVLLCGDIFQTIYGWRGSEPRRILELFKERYNPKEVVFNKNYRGTNNITKASLSFLENSFKESYKRIYKEKIVAESKEEGEKLRVTNFENIREEAYFILNEISSLKDNGIDISSTAILSRDNNYNIKLSRELKSISNYKGVDFEFILIDQYKFFRRQEIKDVIAFLKLIVNRQDSISLKRIVKRLPTGIGDKKFELIESNLYKRVGIKLSDFIEEKVRGKGEKYLELIEEYEKENIVVFDVESTGINITEDEIIQIAAIKIDNKGKIVERFVRFLKNKKSVGTSFKVHGFSDEFLKENGEDKKKVLKDFIEFIKDTIIVGHNVQYDISILKSELSRNNLGEAHFKNFYDTLDIYRRFYPNLTNHKLDTLSEYFKIENKPTHDAFDDILATKDLLIRAINLDIRNTSMERIALMREPLKDFKNIYIKLNNFFEDTKDRRPYEIIGDIVKRFNLESLYSGIGIDGTTGAEKIERLRDFYRLARDIDDKSKNNIDSLLELIQLTSLSNGEMENLIIKKTNRPRIPIITVHQSKGLEYKNVFLVGLQENTFPSYMSLKSNNLEEEKRTFYVAITRAKERLYLLSHTYGDYNRRNDVSRFINNIDNRYKTDIKKLNKSI